MINESQKIRTLEQNHWINIISNELIKSNIQHAFLKGTILNNTLYKYGSRVSNDIDILINKSSIKEVTSILKKLGFIQGKYNYKTKEIFEFSEEEIFHSMSTRGETAPFVIKTNNNFAETIDVDINFSIDWCPNDSKIVKEFLNDNVLILKNDGNKIYSLNNYNNFIELCIHFYKDSALIDILAKRKIIDLYKIIDIYYFIKRYFAKMDDKYLLEQIKKFKLEKYIYFTLIYVTNIFPDCKTPTITNLIKKLKQKDIVNHIFSQYKELKMETNSSITNRVSSYDVIKKYKR